MSQSHGDEPDAPPRTFGLTTASFVVMASMIGTGVLTTSGYTVANVHSNQLMLVMWVVGGIIALCGALTIAELAAAMPRSGGDYVFLREAYGPLVAFLSGWVSFLIGFGAASAAAAYASAKYLLSPLQLDTSSELAQKCVASVLILIFVVAHMRTRSGSIRVQGGVTILKLTILLSLAVAGIAAGWGNWSNLADPPTLNAKTWSEALFSMVYIAYAYIGWNGAGYVAGEVSDPQRRLPIAILLGTGMVVGIYLALNIFYSLALPSAEVVAMADAKQDVAEIARLAAGKVFGPRVTNAISVALGLTLLASLSAFILTGPRVIYAMARAGQFPAIAGRLTGGDGPPGVATLLQGLWAMALVWASAFEPLFVFASVGLSIFGMLTVAAIYVLRIGKPHLPRPFRTPGYPFTPAICLLGTGTLTAAAFVMRWRESSIALGCIVAGVPAYYLWQGLSRPAGVKSEPGT
jgi:basic amino acid/polyamine antiporter, APA family